MMDTAGRTGPPRWWRAARLGWPVGLYVVLLATMSGLGFNPTDEGVVASASQRILDGQVPHVDFATPRPALSAYLHALELLLPTPAFITGRAVALAQILAYSILLAWFVLAEAPGRWAPATVFAVAASVLVNLNTFPLMPWYTVDGLLFASCGLLILRFALQRGRASWIALAFICFALATLSKQSFGPSLVFGLAWVVFATPPGRRLNRATVAVLAGATPLALYAVLVALAGGAGPLVGQLLASEPVFGAELAIPFRSPIPMLLVSALPIAVVIASRTSLIPQPVRASVAAGIAVTLTAVVLGILAGFGLLLAAPWSTLLAWMLAVTVVTDAVVARRFDVRCGLLVALAWMTALSYGLAMPSLIGGTLALAVLHRTWALAANLSHRRPAQVALPVALATFVVVATLAFVGARSTYAHRDLEPQRLTEELGSISQELAGIRTGRPTADYLRAMKACVEQHPAGKVSILPDNAAAYVAFGWDNPLPVDFLYPPEYVGARELVVSRAERLAREGDFLVLFQLVRADALGDSAASIGDGVVHSYDATLTATLMETLAPAASIVDCPPFRGYHAPPR